MRPLIFLAAAIPLALGCAQQSRTRTADVAPDDGLQVQLVRPAGGGIIYSLSEPAYVAIFAISRTGGVGLVYPTLESQAYVASPAGPFQLPVPGQGNASLYNVDRRAEQRGILATADAYYIIASTSPLHRLAEMIQSPRLLGTFLEQFRATTISSAGEAIGLALTAGLPDSEWAEATYFGSRLPFGSIAQKGVMQYCPSSGVASVPMTSTAQCEVLGTRQTSRGGPSRSRP